MQRIGVVLLDYEHYTADGGDFEPTEERGIGRMPPGFFESPASWPLPTSFAVARGATPRATVAAEPVAHRAFAEAAGTLRSRCSVVVADCGFMWGARQDPEIALPGGVVTSALDLLPHAAALVSGPIGILTYSKPDLERLLAGHPLADRLRVIGLRHLPSWGVFLEESYATGGTVDMARIGDELAGHVRAELPADVEALILECTVLPQLRRVLRAVTDVPLFDAMTYTAAIAA